MKPQRPDSAKSAKTRITLDSEVTSNNITQSRFSDTYSHGVRLTGTRNVDFEKYVAEKDKDPKFKKLLEPTLPQIPEKVKPSPELTKLTSKPFQRRQSKADKQKAEPKQEEPKKPEPQQKGVKKQNLQSSKTFIDKSKQKLKIPSKAEIDEQPTQTPDITPKQESEKEIEEKDKKTTANAKPKINLNGFVLNVPGKPPQVIKMEVEKEPDEETKKRIERENIMTQLSQYVNEMEERNADYFPKRYDEFIDQNLENVDLEKINFQDFLEEPTEKDYENVKRKIKENERALQSNEKSSLNGSRSLNLDEIIDGSEKKEEQQEADDVSVIMSSMTASDVRDRNMFLTQILKGKRLTKQDLDQIQENSEIILKLIKIEGKKEENQDEEDIEMLEINMSKKRSNRIIEKNKREAVGDLFRQCDFLSPEEQQRIEDIINGAEIENPFQETEIQRFMSRRIDEGIQLHRQLCRSLSCDNDKQGQTIFEESALPKDPSLRKKAQLKILRERINSVNCRLGSLNEIVVNKAKILQMIERCRQTVRPSKMSESLLQQKRREFDQQSEQLKIADSLLRKVQNERQQMLRLVDEISTKFGTMEQEVVRLQNMDHEERRKLELGQLREKRRKIQEIEREANEFENEVEIMIREGEEIKRKMEVLDQIMSVKSEERQCEGYREGETISDLDELITGKWEAAEEALKIVRNLNPN